MHNLKAQYSYHAYGLDFCSSIALPELLGLDKANADDAVDVRILTAQPAQDRPFPDRWYRISPEEAFIYFDQIGLFSIDHGREIRVAPLPDVEERLLRVPLLGASMAVLLYQRGKFVLHASAVSVGGRAIAFLGDKGYGKSTMAAMLCGLGYELLADDVVAVDLNEVERPVIIPGFPQLKLNPDSLITAYNDDPETLPVIASHLDKRSRRADKFCEVSRPLDAIYVLGGGEDIRISPLPLQQAVQALIANSYTARFTMDWIENGLAASNLRHCVETTKHTPVFLLKRPHDLSKLRDVAHAVEEHISTVEGGFLNPE